MEESTGPTGELVYTLAELIAMNAVPEVTPSPYIITIDELKASQEALSHKEILDKNILLRFVEPDINELKQTLFQWASVGLLDGFQLYSVAVEVPPKCSDGVVRSTFDYIEFLLGSSLSEKIQLLQAKLPGMILSYSIPGRQVCLHVSKG